MCTQNKIVFQPQCSATADVSLNESKRKVCMPWFCVHMGVVSHTSEYSTARPTKGEHFSPQNLGTSAFTTLFGVNGNSNLCISLLSTKKKPIPPHTPQPIDQTNGGRNPSCRRSLTSDYFNDFLAEITKQSSNQNYSIFYRIGTRFYKHKT